MAPSFWCFSLSNIHKSRRVHNLFQLQSWWSKRHCPCMIGFATKNKYSSVGFQTISRTLVVCNYFNADVAQAPIVINFSLKWWIVTWYNMHFWKRPVIHSLPISFAGRAMRTCASESFWGFRKVRLRRAKRSAGTSEDCAIGTTWSRPDLGTRSDGCNGIRAVERTQEKEEGGLGKAQSATSASILQSLYFWMSRLDEIFSIRVFYFFDFSDCRMFMGF